VPHRYDVSRADEEMRLAHVDLTGGRVPGRGPQDHEETRAVLLELRPLVGRVRVLDRELVEPELLLDLAQDVLGWLVQPDPDEVPLLGDVVADRLEVDVGDPTAVGIGGAVDDHATQGLVADRMQMPRQSSKSARHSWIFGWEPAEHCCLHLKAFTRAGPSHPCSSAFFWHCWRSTLRSLAHARRQPSSFAFGLCRHSFWVAMHLRAQAASEWKHPSRSTSKCDRQRSVSVRTQARSSSRARFTHCPVVRTAASALGD